MIFFRKTIKFLKLIIFHCFEFKNLINCAFDRKPVYNGQKIITTRGSSGMGFFRDPVFRAFEILDPKNPI